MMDQEDSGLDESLYSDESAAMTSKTPESVDEESASNPTALVPLSALGGKTRPGDTVTMKVIKLHGDEVEVVIASSGKDTGESDGKMMEDFSKLDLMET